MALPTHVLLMYGYLLLFAWFWWSSSASLCRPPLSCWLPERYRPRPTQLSRGPAGRRRGVPGCRQHLVLHRPPLWPPCAAHPLQAVA